MLVTVGLKGFGLHCLQVKRNIALQLHVILRSVITLHYKYKARAKTQIIGRDN